MTATKNDQPDVDDTADDDTQDAKRDRRDVQDGEVEEYATDETPLQTSQKANLDRVVAQSEDERQGIYGQVIQ